MRWVTYSAANRNQSVKVGKKGDVTFGTETQVGDLNLKPGRYYLQYRVEGEDYVMHFTQVTKGDQMYEAWEAGDPIAHPGEVKCKLEPLSRKVNATTVEGLTDGGVFRVTKIEIAGENVAHVF